MARSNVQVVGRDIPNQATYGLITKIEWELSKIIPGVSVKIESCSPDPWEFLIWFAWEGKVFLTIRYGYGHHNEYGEGGCGSHCLCWSSSTNRKMIPFLSPIIMRDAVIPELRNAMGIEMSRIEKLRLSLSGISIGVPDFGEKEVHIPHTYGSVCGGREMPDSEL